MQKSTQFAAFEKREAATKKYDQSKAVPNPLFTGEDDPISYAPETQTKVIAVSALKSGQTHVDPEHVNALKAQDPARMPPIEVTQNGDDYWVTDGNHRAVASLLRGDAVITAKVKPYR